MHRTALFVLLAVVLLAVLAAVFVALPKGPEAMWALAAVVTAIAALVGALLNNRSAS
jgi:hypothetical protein